MCTRRYVQDLGSRFVEVSLITFGLFKNCYYAAAKADELPFPISMAHVRAIKLSGEVK